MHVFNYNFFMILGWPPEEGRAIIRPVRQGKGGGSRLPEGKSKADCRYLQLFWGLQLQPCPGKLLHNANHYIDHITESDIILLIFHSYW